VARTRISLVVAMVAIGWPAWARPQCRLPSIDVPACAGVDQPFASSFCFGDRCTGTGTVRDVQAPTSPFELVGLRVDGPLGSRPVAEDDFPVVLLPGETMIAELTVRLTGPGSESGTITWVRSGLLRDDRDDDEDREDNTCTASITASVPACRADPANPCQDRTCEAGACVTVPVDGPCGNLCQSGGTCVDGACVGGVPVDCADDNPCTVDLCDLVAGCVHQPSDAACNDGDPCTADSCGPAGCVNTPDPAACDDGDPCTVDSCGPGGCVHTSTGSCDDDDPCTSEACALQHCFRGVSEAGVPCGHGGVCDGAGSCQPG